MSLFEKALTARENEIARRDGEYYKILKQSTEKQIWNYKKEISFLEISLAESMPATSHGQIYCEVCGVKSMKLEETIPIIFDKYNIYKCEICGDKILSAI
jgi:hypothetical protein